MPMKFAQEDAHTAEAELHGHKSQPILTSTFTW